MPQERLVLLRDMPVDFRMRALSTMSPAERALALEASAKMVLSRIPRTERRQCRAYRQRRERWRSRQ